MKAIIEYIFPDDENDYKLANAAEDMYLALNDFAETLRAKWKYGEYKHEETDDEVEKIREEFYDILKEYNVDLNMLP